MWPFLQFMYFFVRWGKERGGGSAEIRHWIGVCVFHSVCLGVRGSWYSADQVPTMAPAPHKDRKRYRGQKQTERKREGKADGGEDRWDEREREMKAERTWGGEDGGGCRDMVRAGIGPTSSAWPSILTRLYNKYFKKCKSIIINQISGQEEV